MAKLMHIMSYSVHDHAPKITAKTRAMELWYVRIVAENQEGEDVEITLMNDQPVYLPAMLPLVMEKLTEALGDLGGLITEGGFNIYKRT